MSPRRLLDLYFFVGNPNKLCLFLAIFCFQETDKSSVKPELSSQERACFLWHASMSKTEYLLN